MPKPDTLVFFLGGQDLEMCTIRELLAETAPDRWYDKKLGWGAKASVYGEEIGRTLAAGYLPVLIELVNDLALSAEQCLVVDHHGERAGTEQPTSLHQVFSLLGLPPSCWSRWFDLVAANDRGYIPALVAIGATQEEIVRVRRADRIAQGITPAEEQAGAEAAANIEVVADGALAIAHLPHARTATVVDRLQPELGGPGYPNILVYSPDQVNFFGEGSWVFALSQRFPDGWYGGALPERGFWGHCKPVPEVRAVLSRLLLGAEEQRSAE